MIKEPRTSVLISMCEITGCIAGLFEKRGIHYTEETIYKMYDSLFRDLFFPGRDYLGYSLAFLNSLGLTTDKIYNDLAFVYNQLYYAIDQVRISENKFYLDKVSYDLENLNLLRLTYDPKADTRLRAL